MPRRPPPSRAEYGHFERQSTRWMDNDAYGHVNNAHYYAFFDSAVNRYLITAGGLDVRGGPVIGLVVSSACDYFAPVAYPEALELGVRADRLGTSSATYGVALFVPGEDAARAAGTMTHVFVDRATARPVPIPARIREALEAIRVRATG
jgi:acyl-CoA thioester hydrolase